MDRLVGWIARTLVVIIQSLPLLVVAWIGRAGGAVAYALDVRHRRVALKNLTLCFGGEKSPEEIRALARENFRRIGESYFTAIKCASQTNEEILRYLTCSGGHWITKPAPGEKPRSIIVAVGHFGNFEMYARVGNFLPAYQVATTYRGLKPPSVNRLMQSLREKSGCLYFDRRSDGNELKVLLRRPGILFGLLADQRTINGSLRLPFLGRECSTNAAPAIFARRYQAALHTCICHRTGPAQWHLEFGPEIPTQQDGRPRSSQAIMRDVNQALEAAVRRDPANWFWVHDRWKSPPPKPAESETSATHWETTVTQ